MKMSKKCELPIFLKKLKKLIISRVSCLIFLHEQQSIPFNNYYSYNRKKYNKLSNASEYVLKQ